MKIVPHYGNNAFIVPGTVLGQLPHADKTSLSCLLYCLAYQEFDSAVGAAELGIGEAEFTAALSFWEKEGVIEVHGMTKRTSRPAKSVQKHTDTKNVATERKKFAAASLPSYSTEETAKFLEENAATADIIDSCENIIGKIFTTAETNIIIGMMDHLSLSGDYILLLFAHAAKMDKKSVRYVEKLALSFADRDITKYHELEEELASIELAEDTSHRVRKLFGIGNRALTAKEKKMITDWCVTWSFEYDIIEKAYEVTVNSTGKASLSYANTVLGNWYKAGLKTTDDIEKSSAEYEKNKRSVPKGYQKSANNTPAAESSFDTDEFWDAALKRSFDEDPRKRNKNNADTDIG